MGRIYKAAFQGITVGTATQDVFEILCPADMVIRVHKCQITDETSETSEQGVVVFKRGVVGVTSGSGGGTITPSPLSYGDAASGVTVERNNTTVAVTGTGSFQTIESLGFNWLSGFLYLPAPEDRADFSPGQFAIFTIPTVLGVARVCSGVLTFEEIGG